MQTQDTASIQAKTRRIDVAILSDDVNLCAMLQHALAMSRKPRFRVDILSPANFTSDTCNENQLVFLDRIYRAQPYLNTLREFAISQRGVRSKIVLLLDEEELNHDLGGFAAAFKNGVDALLLRTEISLQKIIDLLQHSTSSLGSNAPEANRDLAFVTDSNSATTTSTPTATAPTQAQTTDDCFAHSLAIDLESERIHIAANRDSPLFDEADTILSLRDWEARLDARGAEQFNELLHNAVEYRNIVQAIHCQVTSDAGTPLAATIGEIQIKNNGQGRVVGASAELLVYAQREESAFAPREGFDNLFDPAGDSSELLVAQQGWENIARSLPMMCLLLDEGGYVTQIVNNEEHLHQQFPRAAIGRRLSEILDIDSLDNLVDTISRTLNTGKAHQQTIAFATSQGTRWLDTHITKLKGDAGLSRQAVWTAFDITATRHSYQELLKAHDELFHLLDEAPILFFQKDGNGRFLRANKTFCDHFNVRADVIS
ncbi:MAG: PAS domain-containing protein, partial [Pseudomonadales bacterium]|nr:PAS domain-containing protein [Pseudomonadales bacterium]